MKKFFILASVFLLILSSCKKENSGNNPTCNKTVADIAGTYSLVKVEGGLAEPLLDVTSTEVKPCQLDNKIILNANGTTNYSDIGVLCSPPENNAAGTWSISPEGKITVSAGTVVVTNADIISYDCTTLVILTDRASGFGTIKVRLTIKK